MELKEKIIKVENVEQLKTEIIKITYDFVGFDFMKDLILMGLKEAKKLEHKLSLLNLLYDSKSFLKKEDSISFNALLGLTIENVKKDIEIRGVEDE